MQKIIGVRHPFNHYKISLCKIKCDIHIFSYGQIGKQ